MKDTYHSSVLLHEAIDSLQIKPGKTYIDGTLGGAGHTREILKRGGRVLGIDFDQDALSNAKLRVESGELRNDKSLILARGNFKDVDKIAQEHGVENAAGILLDLGVSSHHFDEVGRGFSFQHEAELDMRMDQTLTLKAADLINVLPKHELAELFLKLGEEWKAKAIADAVAKARQVSPIKTTTELAKIVSKVVPSGKPGINPATKVFQALRIAVNDELNNVREVLPKAVHLLERGGRLVIITFHSLEDRIVKHTFKDFAADGLGTIITKKPIVPSDEEDERNKRARSAKLRVFEKVNG